MNGSAVLYLAPIALESHADNYNELTIHGPAWKIEAVCSTYGTLQRACAGEIDE